jgi:MFS family permease
MLWSSVIAGTGVGLSTPALIRVSTESIPEGRAGLGAGVYKTVNELGAVFGVLLLGALLEGRIVKNALDQAFGVAVLLAVVGVAVALLLPKRLEKR